MNRVRRWWRAVRHPMRTLRWRCLRFPWNGMEEAPLPVIIAHLRAFVAGGWAWQDRVKKLEDRVTTLELDKGYPEEEGR